MSIGDEHDCMALVLDEWHAEHQITVRMVGALPAAQLDWSPHEKSRSCRELVGEFIFAERFFLSAIRYGAFRDESNPRYMSLPDELPALLKLFAESHAELRQALAALTSSQWQQAIPYGPWPDVIKPAWTYLRWHISHEIHHRGQLSVYLRLLGCELPSIYGPTADTKDSLNLPGLWFG